MAEREMNQRDLVSTAIKILGLCLLVLGLLAAARDSLAAYFAHQEIQQQIAEQQAEADDPERQWQSNTSIMIQQMRRTQHLSQLGYHIIQVLAALYLCRRGTLVLNFLTGGPNDGIAEQHARQVSSEAAPSASPAEPSA